MNYQKAFDEFLVEEGISNVGKMDAVAIAAMFKAGSVTVRSQRRGILRVLRHHFGKRSFVAEKDVELLCDGHSEVMTGEVLYRRG